MFQTTVLNGRCCGGGGGDGGRDSGLASRTVVETTKR